MTQTKISNQDRVGTSTSFGSLLRGLIPWAVLFVAFDHGYLPAWTALPIGIVMSLRMFFWFRVDRLLTTGIGLCFLPSEFGLWFYQFVLLQILLVLFVRGKRFARIPLLVIGWIGWCFLSYILSQRLDENGLAFWMFALTFVGSIVPLFVIAGLGVSLSDIKSAVSFFLGCLVVQGLMVSGTGLRMLLQTGSITVMDWGFGSAYIALPFLLVAGIAFLAAPVMRRIIFRQSHESLAHPFLKMSILALLCFTLHLTGSITVIFAAIVAFGLACGIPILFASLHRTLRVGWLITLGIAVGFGSILGSWYAIGEFFGPNYLKTWVEDGIGPGGQPLNHKYVFLERALSDIPENYGSWWTGTGPGTVGSRASNVRAYDTMYKEEERKRLIAKLFTAHTSPPAARFFSDLFQEGFAKSSRFRSTTLSQPFSSLISVFVETGIIGFVLLAAFFANVAYLSLRCALHSSSVYAHTGIMVYVMTICLFGLAFFDTYLERPTMMTAYWIFVGFVVHGASHISSKSPAKETFAA